jgi:hypothetical protein
MVVEIRSGGFTDKGGSRTQPASAAQTWLAWRQHRTRACTIRPRALASSPLARSFDQQWVLLTQSLHLQCASASCRCRCCLCWCNCTHRGELVPHHQWSPYSSRLAREPSLRTCVHGVRECVKIEWKEGILASSKVARAGVCAGVAWVCEHAHS